MPDGIATWAQEYFIETEGRKKGRYPEKSETGAELEVQWSWSSRAGVKRVFQPKDEPIQRFRAE